MLSPPSPRSAEFARRITAFMEEHIYPAEPVFEREVREGDHWDEPPPVMAVPQEQGEAGEPWNLFVPKKHDPDGLSVTEYALLCEIMGRSPIGAEPFNCSAPDTGNMETLDALRQRRAAGEVRLAPLLMAGEIRLASLATRAGGRLVGCDQHPLRDHARRRQLRHQRAEMVVVRARMDKRLQARDLHGRQTEPGDADPHKRQSMILVPMGTRLLYRPCGRSPCSATTSTRLHGHAEVIFANVRVPAANILLGEEAADLEIAQGRLGPGPHPPLHAHDRHGGARAGNCCAGAPSTRSSLWPSTHRGAWRHAPPDRRDRAWRSTRARLAHHARRADDGHGRQQGGAVPRSP